MTNNEAEGLLEPAEFGITRVPRHVAIIMDGNGRWANKRGMPRIEGHRQGANSVRTALRTAYRLGVEYLTLYAFSEQNWGRPEDEVEGLMGLLLHHLRIEQEELMERGIRFRGMGELDKLPPKILGELRAFEKRSEDNEDMQLTIALSYGGRLELVRAARLIAAKVAAGELEVDAIDESTLGRHLYLGDLPDPDLMIRTSGEMRVSNFMLWQLAYTELYVTDTFWPDFGQDAFIEALKEYSRRERRFGLTGAQAAPGGPST